MPPPPLFPTARSVTVCSQQGELLLLSRFRQRCALRLQRFHRRAHPLQVTAMSFGASESVCWHARADCGARSNSPSNLKGERVRLSRCVGARTAYRRDRRRELSPLRPLAQVVGGTFARRSRDFHLQRCALRSPTRDVMRLATCGFTCPVDGSRPYSRTRGILPNGESSGACAGLPTHPHALACLHSRLVPHATRCKCLRHALGARRQRRHRRCRRCHHQQKLCWHAGVVVVAVYGHATISVVVHGRLCQGS